MRGLLPLVAVAVLAAAAGWSSRGPTTIVAPAAAGPVSPVAAGAPATPAVPAARYQGLTADEMRALLAEHAAAATAGKTAAEPREEPTSESLERIAEVEAAVHDGVWSADDRALLRRSLGQMSQEQAMKVLTSLAGRVNHRQLRPEGPIL